jgi:hypothetical protein
MSFSILAMQVVSCHDRGANDWRPRSPRQKPERMTMMITSVFLSASSRVIACAGRRSEGIHVQKPSQTTVLPGSAEMVQRSRNRLLRFESLSQSQSQARTEIAVLVDRRSRPRVLSKEQDGQHSRANHGLVAVQHLPHKQENLPSKSGFTLVMGTPPHTAESAVSPIFAPSSHTPFFLVALSASFTAARRFAADCA